MSMPPQFDAKSVLIDKLGEDNERFQISNLYFKNAKGLSALFEIRKLKAELLDFAKDPSMKDNDLGPLKPKQPDISKLDPDEATHELEAWRKLMREYEIAVTALRMQVPVPDMFAIEQYMKPFDDTIAATPAVKGRRFHAFTKNPEDENKGGLFGMRQARNATG